MLNICIVAMKLQKNGISAENFDPSNRNHWGELGTQHGHHATAASFEVFGHICALNSDGKASLTLLYISCLKVIPVRWIHNSAATLHCWLLLLALNLSEGSKNELQHLHMPKHIPPKMFFMFLIVCCSRQSAEEDWQEEISLSLSMQNYVLHREEKH